MSKQIKIILSIVAIIIMAGLGYVFWPKNVVNNGDINNPPTNTNGQSPDNQESEVIDLNVDTSDWIEYINTALGYKVKFPKEFKAFAEANQIEIPFDEKSEFLITHDNKGSTRVWIAKINHTDNKEELIKEFEKLKEAMPNYIYIKDNKFIFGKHQKKNLYNETYAILTKDYIIGFSFIKMKDSIVDDFKYIRDGVLSTFELIEP